MIHDIADFVFSHLCHQEAARCWAPGGVVLAFCQRCAGVYAGAALMLLLLPLMKFKPTKKILVIHGLFIIQMVIFGFHLIPHSATVRTLSGQLFIIGAFYFLWLNVQNRWDLFQTDRSPRSYFGGIIIMLLLMQLFVRAPFAFASAFVEILGLLGLVTIVIAAVVTVFKVCTFTVLQQLREKIKWLFVK